MSNVFLSISPSEIVRATPAARDKEVYADTFRSWTCSTQHLRYVLPVWENVRRFSREPDGTSSHVHLSGDYDGKFNYVLKFPCSLCGLAHEVLGCRFIVIPVRLHFYSRSKYSVSDLGASNVDTPVWAL